MPAVVVAALTAFFSSLVPVLMQWALKVLAGLGVTFVSYNLLSLAVQQVLDAFARSYYQIWTTYKTMKFLAK